MFKLMQSLFVPPTDKAVAGGTASPKPAPKLVSVPFVVDGFTFDQTPSIWKSKPSAKNPAPTRVGVNLGSITIRIAGSAISYAVPCGISFEAAGSDPAPRVNVPTDDAYIPQPLFKSDTPEAAADLDRFVADAGTKFFEWYSKNHADKIPLETVDHKYLADRVGVTTAAKVR